MNEGMHTFIFVCVYTFNDIITPQNTTYKNHTKCIHLFMEHVILTAGQKTSVEKVKKK